MYQVILSINKVTNSFHIDNNVVELLGLNEYVKNLFTYNRLLNHSSIFLKYLIKKIYGWLIYCLHLIYHLSFTINHYFCVLCHVIEMAV